MKEKIPNDMPNMFYLKFYASPQFLLHPTSIDSMDTKSIRMMRVRITRRAKIGWVYCQTVQMLFFVDILITKIILCNFQHDKWRHGQVERAVGLYKRMIRIVIQHIFTKKIPFLSHEECCLQTKPHLIFTVFFIKCGETTLRKYSINTSVYIYVTIHINTTIVINGIESDNICSKSPFPILECLLKKCYLQRLHIVISP